MASGDRAVLDRENQRLLEQAARFSHGEIARAEAERWRERTPEQRLAELGRLCRMVPWYRKQWPDEVRRRVRVAGPPTDVIALLESMRRQGGASAAAR